MCCRPPVLTRPLPLVRADGKQKAMLSDSFFQREYTKGDTVIRQVERLFYRLGFRV